MKKIFWRMEEIEDISQAILEGDIGEVKNKIFDFQVMIEYVKWDYNFEEMTYDEFKLLSAYIKEKFIGLIQHWKNQVFDDDKLLLEVIFRVNEYGVEEVKNVLEDIIIFLEEREG